MLQNRWYNQFRAAQSSGILPNEKPAKAMRMKKAIFWTVDLLGFGIGSKTKSGEWTVTISNADESQLFFKQLVKLSLMLVSLSVPGLSLFTWNVINGTSGEKYETSFVAGVPTTPENIGQFLQGGTVFSEQGIAIPGSGNESTNLTATILFDYFSPIYLFGSPGRMLPPGYKVRISRDTWGIGTANSTYGFAFEDGALGLDTKIDAYDALLTARVGVGESILTSRAWPGGDYRVLLPTAPVSGSDPFLTELSDGRLLLAVKVAEGYVEMQSHNSGWTWERLKYPDSDGGLTPKARAVWPPETQMPLSLKLDDQTRLSIAVDGAQLLSRVVSEHGLSESVVVGAASSAGAYSLEEAPDGRLLIIDETGRPLFSSNGLPLAWRPVVAT